MRKKISEDEIDIIEIILIIWENKWKVIIITFFFTILSAMILENQKVEKVNYISRTEIKPISITKLNEYEIYNSYLKEFQLVVDGSGQEFIKEFFLKNDGSSQEFSISEMSKNNLVYSDISSIPFSTFDSNYLLYLYLDKLKDNSIIANTIKEFGMIDEKEFKNKDAYEKSVIKFANSIKLLTKKVDDIYTYTIEHRTNDLKKWEEFLIFLESKINSHVQIYVNEKFYKLIENEEKIRDYKLEDIDFKISISNSQKSIEDLKRTKLMLMNNKKMERLKKLFESTPASNIDKFYAAEMEIYSSEYENISKQSISKNMKIFYASIVGLIISIFYILIVNAIKKRSINK